MADFRRDNVTTATNSIKMRLVLEAVGKDAKIEVTDQDVEDKVQELATTYNRKVEDLKANEEIMSQIKSGLEQEKAVDYLLENAKKVAKKTEDKKIDEKKEEQEESAKKTTTQK